MKRNDRETRQENYLYLIVWGVLFAAVPLTRLIRWLIGSSPSFPFTDFFRSWGMMLPFLALFLIHNYLIAPVLVRKRKVPLYLALTAVLLVLFSFFTVLGHQSFPPEDHPGPRPPHERPVPPPARDPDGFPAPNPPMSPETMKIIMGILLLGVNLGVKFFYEARRSERRMQQLKTENLNHQLEYLRYQINPHFFMNTLNNIHALVDIDPEKAKESIEEFSKLMRFVLYEGNLPTIPLSREVEFLRHFVSLMRIRFAEEVQIETAYPDETSKAEIPPLLLVSFVENAFKHGISYNRASFVRMSVTLNGGNILFLCDNSRQEGDRPKEHGVGLANVRKRLDLLYEDRYTLDIREEPETYRIRLQLPATPGQYPASA